MAVAIPIIVILVLAVATTIVLAANRQRGTTGLLSRETRHRDAGPDAVADDEMSTSTELETTGRQRADDTRAAYENVPTTRGSGDVERWEPVDERSLKLLFFARRHRLAPFTRRRDPADRRRRLVWLSWRPCCPGGGIGRRAGFRYLWPQGRGSSSLLLGTITQ